MSVAKVPRYVYFIKPIGMDGPIKIGVSDCPRVRLENLAAWSPWPLEIVGCVTGTGADESFLHDCFLDLHSHHEWFRSSPELRETIAEVLAAGSVDVVRDKLARKGKMRGRKRSAEQRLRASYSHRIRWACTKLRAYKADETIYFHAPSDVDRIMDAWSGNSYRGVPGVAPSEADIARIEEFLANPAVHATRNVVKRIVPKTSGAAA